MSDIHGKLMAQSYAAGRRRVQEIIDARRREAVKAKLLPGTVYVDALMAVPAGTRAWRWPESCHLFVAAGTDLNVLHTFAGALGLRYAWFQEWADLPHYDLHRNKRALAVKLGAVEVDRAKVVATMREYRERPLESGAHGVTRPGGVSGDGN